MLGSYIIKLSLLFCTVGLLSLSSCQQEQANLSLGSVIRQSLTYTQDSLFLPTPSGSVGLVIKGTDIDLDFGGASLIGAKFGASPDLQTGTAIKVEKAQTLSIRNAHFLGFQIGIHIQEVDTLILENCHFDHFRRSKTGGSPSFTSIGLQIEKAQYVILKNSSWQRMDQGLQTVDVPEITIQQCSFLWMNSNAVQLAQTNVLACTSSLFAYIGLPKNEVEVFRYSDSRFQFKENHFAHCQLKLASFPDFDLDFNPVAYTDFIPSEEWDRPKVDQLLLQKGISTPSLSLLDQWGWYDFSYPKAWFRQGNLEEDVYLLTAPPGNWRIIDGAGYNRLIPKTGAFPSTVKAEISPDSKERYLVFEFLGKPLKKFGKPFNSNEVFTFKGQANEKENQK